jgi:LacI family transcriptional regulator
MAANDLMAVGAISEIEFAGLQVPQDISVIGFDDIAFAAVTRPPLTTVHLPLKQLGSKAVEMLLSSMEDLKRTGIEVRIPALLVVRESTAPAASSRRLQGNGKKKGLEKHTV